MHHILYSCHKCPYATRTRMAIKYAGIRTEIREINPDATPDSLKIISPKATVPVLVKPDGSYLDESWDIVKWAVAQNDPDSWQGEQGGYLIEAEMLIEMNDYSFKEDLDRYINADNYPQHPATWYREQAEEFLQDLEERLGSSDYLMGDTLSIADIGIFPFVRQFAEVEPAWFAGAPFPALRNWLNSFLDSKRPESGLYSSIMKPYPLWQMGDKPVFLG